LVVLVGALDLEHRQRRARAVGQRDPVAVGLAVDREADRQRPRQVVGEPQLVDDALVVVLGHEALEPPERARGEHVQVGQLPRGQLELLELLGAVGPRARAIDELAAVRRNQLIHLLRDAHAATSAGTRPSCSSLATTCAAASSGSSSSVSITSSGSTGSSYGSETPVNSVISPLNAFS